MRHGIRNSIGKRGLAWLLTLLLLLGHGAIYSVAGSGDTLLFTDADFCHSGSDEPASPFGQAPHDHDHCVFHCGLGSPAIAPPPLMAATPARPVRQHLAATKDVHLTATRSIAHNPRAPPLSASLA